MLGETEKFSDVCRTASLSEMGHEQRAATSTSSTVTDQRRKNFFVRKSSFVTRGTAESTRAADRRRLRLAGASGILCACVELTVDILSTFCDEFVVQCVTLMLSKFLHLWF